MKSKVKLALASPLLLLTGCGAEQGDPRGVDREETLLSVSATGEADTAPDEARFQAGIENWARDAQAATQATEEDIAKIVAALRELGIEDRDIQTRTINVQRIDWGDRRGQFQAANTVIVRVRDLDKASAAVSAVTAEGANILSGPELRVSDVEAAANTAYANAFRAARARADAYAEAANLEVARVLTIRDAGGSQGDRYLPGAVPPPPVMAQRVANEQAASDAGSVIMPGETTSTVAIQVDFALVAK